MVASLFKGAGAALALCVACVAGTLAFASAAAHAAAITYADGGNVWIASTDGAIKKQLTANATSDLKYYGPSQADNGKIAVIFGKLSRGASQLQVLSSSGKMEKTGLLQLSTCGAFGQLPSAFGYTRIDPAGEVIAYDYLCTNTQIGGGTNTYVALASASNPGGFVGGEPLQAVRVWRPSWLPTTAPGGAAPDMVVTSQAMTTLDKLSWITPLESQTVFNSNPDANTYISSGSVSRTGNVMAYSWTEPDDTKSIYLSRLSGPYEPGVSITAECRLVNTRESLNPSVSPDGTRVAWSDEGGTKVADVAIPDGSGNACGGSTRVISTSGGDPVFSAASPPTSGGGSGGGGSATGLSVKGPSKATRSRVRKGLSFSTKCAKRCTVKATMSAGGKSVARGTKKLKKKGTARLKLRARLAKTVTTVTVVVRSSGKSATLTIPISG